MRDRKKRDIANDTHIHYHVPCLGRQLTSACPSPRPGCPAACPGPAGLSASGSRPGPAARSPTTVYGRCPVNKTKHIIFSMKSLQH